MDTNLTIADFIGRGTTSIDGVCQRSSVLLLFKGEKKDGRLKVADKGNPS